ncbi:GATA zinc finger domain-containing protein 10-like isoform X2 [Cucumis melo var. makuwa]|uniref:GATA zinc finger domain-containing protein 10-like isoform X2 n=1 Tax=Cucumis melo var. makuwa TaxID=1194695 RepID=A0A5A7VBU8_CUCMM|nr:GATA zinc finger domain-containing protein 10-like isoform X2 [Cucumis melo var. makuwa]
MDVTQKYIHWYNNITRLYITRPGAARSNNAKLRDVADDPQQVLDICNNNERYIEEIHNMYDLPIVPPPVHRGRVRVEEAELDEGSIHHLHTWMSVHQLLTCMDMDVTMGNITNICIMKHLQMYQIDKSTNKNQRTKRTENHI